MPQEWRGSKRFNWLRSLETARINFASAINMDEEPGPGSHFAGTGSALLLPHRSSSELHRLSSSTHSLCPSEDKLQAGQRFPVRVRKFGTPLPACPNQAAAEEPRSKTQGTRATSSPCSGASLPHTPRTGKRRENPTDAIPKYISCLQK